MLKLAFTLICFVQVPDQVDAFNSKNTTEKDANNITRPCISQVENRMSSRTTDVVQH